ncbi:MAG: hypothetical protein EPO65_11685 [Dehalococcoidia bacterium]|nr:MAG: hypothetical protein EPO65_11685 [Dehalococcoidia bacterium]
MPYDRCSVLSRVNAVCSGERREALNIAAASSGSIHDDAKAAELGFKGGLVSGLVHNEQFIPIALDLFGTQWLERGGFAFAYRTPTLDGEPVQAFARVPADGATQVEAWSQNDAGQRVADGVLFLGKAETPLAQRLAASQPAEGRILRNVALGSFGPPRRLRVSAETQALMRDTTTEPLDWYFGPSPWGPAFASTRSLYRMLEPRAVTEAVDPTGVRVDAGIEIRFVDGPPLVEVQYDLDCQAVARSESAKTEVLWLRTVMREASSGRVVVEQLMEKRWMKSASALWR